MTLLPNQQAHERTPAENDAGDLQGAATPREDTYELKSIDTNHEAFPDELYSEDLY